MLPIVLQHPEIPLAGADDVDENITLVEPE